MSEEPIKIPTWFWVVMSLCLLWNLLGLMAFFNHIFISPETIAALPDAEQELYKNTPHWVNIAFAFAVIGGTLGCILGLLKKSLSQRLFVLSLVGVLIQMYHSFFIANAMAVYGPGSAVMPSLVIIIGIFLVWLSRSATSKQWLN
jgi:hypothetical protein